MRVSTLGLLSLGLLSVLAAFPVQAEWREASGDHFVIYGDENEQALAGFVERLQLAFDRFKVDERIDRLARCHGGQTPDVLWRAAKAGAFEEVCGPLVVPVCGGDGSEVVSPRRIRLCRGRCDARSR